jgi:hypothetical protein
MTLVIKIPEKDDELKDTLQKEHNLLARIKHHGLFVRIPENNIPREVLKLLSDREYVVFLELMEYGSFGFSQVVCGPKGQPLTPLYIQKDFTLFSTTKAFVTITCRLMQCDEKEIQIRRHILQKDPHRVFVRQQLIYTGDPPPPYTLREFDRAAEAAIEKSMCREHHEPCYIAHA